MGFLNGDYKWGFTGVLKGGFCIGILNRDFNWRF